jgi:hypothetical protein
VSAYELVVYRTGRPEEPIVQLSGLKENRVLVGADLMGRLERGQFYSWIVRAVNAPGTTESIGPHPRFKVDPNLPPVTTLAKTTGGPHGLLLAASLAGKPEPETGALGSAIGTSAASGPRGIADAAVATDGKQGMLVYRIESFPDEDYSVALWINLTQLPANRLGQVFSAWASPMDDPLRICVEGGKLFARIEAGQSYSTPGVVVQTNAWRHIAAVKRGTDLRLYVDGDMRGQATVPLFLQSQAAEVGLGGNPRFPGHEFLAARFARFQLFERALDAAEIKRLATWPGD